MSLVLTVWWGFTRRYLYGFDNDQEGEVTPRVKVSVSWIPEEASSIDKTKRGDSILLETPVKGHVHFFNEWWPLPLSSSKSINKLTADKHKKMDEIRPPFLWPLTCFRAEEGETNRPQRVKDAIKGWNEWSRRLVPPPISQTTRKPRAHDISGPRFYTRWTTHTTVIQAVTGFPYNGEIYGLPRLLPGDMLPYVNTNTYSCHSPFFSSRKGSVDRCNFRHRVYELFLVNNCWKSKTCTV